MRASGSIDVIRVTPSVVASGVPEVRGPVGRDTGQLGKALDDLGEPCAEVRKLFSISVRSAGSA